jgi:Protein of unknown function (DUF2877)
MPDLRTAAVHVPGAAGAALRQRLRSSCGSGVVLHAGDHAVYVRIDERVVGVTSSRATHAPSSIRTALPRLPRARVGDPAQVRDGALEVAGLRVSIGRVVATRAPQVPDRVRAAGLLAERLPNLGACRAQLPESALAGLRDADPGAVPRLLGRGDGLTPLGDDVLAGWLVTRRAVGAATDPVAHAVARNAARTTALSATLLADAAAGECLPELRDLLLALRSGAHISDAVDALATVGHTSGSGMLLGADLALSPRSLERSSR